MLDLVLSNFKEGTVTVSNKDEPLLWLDCRSVYPHWYTAEIIHNIKIKLYNSKKYKTVRWQINHELIYTAQQYNNNNTIITIFTITVNV